MLKMKIQGLLHLEKNLGVESAHFYFVQVAILGIDEQKQQDPMCPPNRFALDKDTSADNEG